MTRQINKIKNNLAKSLIWISAAITFLILAMIVGFILINGLITHEKKRSSLLPLTESSFFITEGSQWEEYSLWTSRTLRIDHMDYDDLRDIFSGENHFWGFLSGQNRNIQPILSSDAEFLNGLKSYLNMTGQPYSDRVLYYQNEDELLRYLEANKGALAIVPSSIIPKSHKLKKIGIRQLSLIRGATEETERHLKYLDYSTIQEIYRQKITQWSELNDKNNSITGFSGNLPLKTWIYSPEEGPYSDQMDLWKAEIKGFNPALRFTQWESMIEILNETPEALILAPRELVLKENLETIEVVNPHWQPNLRLSFLTESPSRAGAVGGISYIILNTLVMILFVMLITTPIGLGAAIYLVHYSKQGKLLTLMKLGTDTLAGIPSIIFGLFGMVFFSQFLGLKTGLMSGALTLTIMILPTIIRTSEEAIRSVPNSLMTGSMALGATKQQSLIRVVIPAAAPGILTGMILAIGRAIGETAALLFTMGSNMSLLRNLNSPMRVLSVHLYMLIRENISMANAFATATLLMLIVFLVNYLTRRFINPLPGNS